MVFGNYAFTNPGSERVEQWLIAFGPFALLLFLRMIFGRSKEIGLGVWLSIGWFAVRVSLNPQFAFLQDYLRQLERFVQG